MSYTPKQAFVLIGPSGSGKSTVRKALEQKYPAAAFSLDDCRVDMFLENSEGEQSDTDLYSKAFDYCNNHGKAFDKFVEEEWEEVLNADTVIVDNTHGTRKSRAKWVEGLRKNKFHITMIQMQTPLTVILERQQTRGDKTVPEAAVIAQYKRQEEVMVGSECDKLIIVDGTKPLTQIP